MNTYAIILASGSGTRCKTDIPKQFIKIGNKTILEHTLDIFENNKNINYIILVTNFEYINKVQELIKPYKKIKKILSGGETRKESSFIGVSAIEEMEANVLIHDCARPLLSQSLLNNCINSLSDYEALVPAIPVSDTILKINDDKTIDSVLERSSLIRVQTPQCFKLTLIKKAHELSVNDNTFTDDCGLIVKYNLAKVHYINGDYNNIKITYPQDIQFAATMVNKNTRQ